MLKSSYVRPDPHRLHGDARKICKSIVEPLRKQTNDQSKVVLVATLYGGLLGLADRVIALRDGQVVGEA